MAKLTQTRLSELLQYDPETGKFFWLVTRSHGTAGAEAGHLSKRGYIVIGVDGHVYKAHRLAWLYMTGHFPLLQIDHRDGDFANNKWLNLREANTSNNKANNPGYKGKKSGLPKGVMRSGTRYMAQIRARGKFHYLGTFSTIDAAANAYCQAAQYHFGEFANGGR